MDFQDPCLTLKLFVEGCVSFLIRKRHATIQGGIKYVSLMKLNNHAWGVWSNAALKSTNSKNIGCFFAVRDLMDSLDSVYSVSCTTVFPETVLLVHQLCSIPGS